MLMSPIPISPLPPTKNISSQTFSTRKSTHISMSLDGPSPVDLVFNPPPSASSPSHHSSRPTRHFYVAVDRCKFKMETLLDLLGVVGSHKGLPIVLCCSSRDELDAVCAAVSNLSYISVSSLYSDLSENARAAILEKFRYAITGNQSANLCPSIDDEADKQVKRSHMIVITDVCLPFVTSGEQPIMARVLINFELPTKKEIYLRRMSTCLASDGIVINMVVGGEVVILRSIEETSGFFIAEMPVNISEIL